MKIYKLSLEDKEKNELQGCFITAKNKIDALKIAEKVKATSLINDLHKIVTTIYKF